MLHTFPWWRVFCGQVTSISVQLMTSHTHYNVYTTQVQTSYLSPYMKGLVNIFTVVTSIFSNLLPVFGVKTAKLFFIICVKALVKLNRIASDLAICMTLCAA